MKIYFIFLHNINQNGIFLQMFNNILSKQFIYTPTKACYFIFCSKITKSSLLTPKQRLN